MNLNRVSRFAGTCLPPANFIRATAVLFVTLVFLIVSRELPSASQATPDVLASDVDSTVSPRQDFFQYANGEWLKRNPIPEDRTSWGIGNVASDELYAQVRAISETVAAERAARGSAEQLIGAVWATAMDSSTINAQGLKPLQPELDRIDRIGSIGDFIDFVAVMHRRRMLIDDWLLKPSVLFADGVEPDDSQSDRRIYSLSQNGVSIGRRYSASDPQSAKVRDALHEYLFKTFLRLNRDSAKAKASAEAVYNIEALLAAGFESSGESHRMGLTELTQTAPTIDWNRYFRRLGVNTTRSINVRNPQFFRTLDSLLRTVPLEDWKDYVRFWLIKVNAPFLDDATFGEFFAYKSALSGQPEPPPKWRRVVWQEKNWLGLPLAKLYVEKYFRKDTMARYESVGQSIRQAFQNRIEHLDWMSDSTRHSALLKLDRLKITIGYPEKRIDFSTMSLQRDSYVLNMIRSAEWFHDQDVKGLNRRIDAADWTLHLNVGGDAEYDDSANEVRVQSPVKVTGLRDEELDDAFVYGSTFLGHEIAHAFDSGGRHYDAYGNKVDWWTMQDAAAFDQRAQALIDEYSEFMPLEGLHINGKNTLRENMADLVGLRVALDAFKKTPQFNNNQTVGGFTPLQRFFLAYAYSHMGQQRREALAASLRSGGGYAPARERVNGAVMNIPEFYEAFGVRPGDPMYRPESARVRIW